MLIARANAADPAIVARFSEERFPECFKEYADLLSWDAYWHTTLDTSNPPFWNWFVGGRMNASNNCADRPTHGGLPQDPHLFETTIAENLRPARPSATRTRRRRRKGPAPLLDPLAAAGLGHTRRRARHRHLRRRAAADRTRALLARRALLVLNEPTIHLEPAVRRGLTTDLLDITRGQDTLLITHDLTGLDEVEEIVVLDRVGS